MMPATPAAAAAQIRQRPLPSSSACFGDPRPRASLRLPARPRAGPMSAEARAAPSPVPVPVPPPAHPTYDLGAVIALALSEDAGDRGDVSCLATIPSDVKAEATFIAKEDGVIAGISLAEMIFKQVDPSLKVEWFEDDGNYVSKGLQFGKVYGCAQSIIVAERVVLNFMQRMSGIATMTKAMADAARPACILETRKTAPGLRLVDKWAVETRTLEEVSDLLKYADENKNKTSLTRIMLDNMVVPLPNGDIDVSMLKDAVQLINGRFETEASGNVTMDTVKKIGETGVTYISSGALTHSVKALDISLKIDTELALQVGRRTNRA